jgi:hypothetical protein
MDGMMMFVCLFVAGVFAVREAPILATNLASALVNLHLGRIERPLIPYHVTFVVNVVYIYIYI